MKYVPNCASPTDPNGMLSRRICLWVPSGSTMVFSATCEFEGLTSSGSSTFGSLVRPMTRSCSSIDSAFPGHHRQPPVGNAEADGPLQRRQIGEQRPQLGLGSGMDGHHQKMADSVSGE